MAHSIPFTLSAAVVSALQTAMEADGVIVRDNPVTRAALEQGDRVVFVEDADDAPIDKPGQAEGRTFAFTVGVINRTDEARAGADLDMQAVKAAIPGALLAAGRALQSSRDIVSFQAPREGRRTYRVEGLDVGGALILTRYELDYRTPAARG
ncbi:MAG: hypothetical protein RL456_2290 [Pseudomonadota bacterium]|jgi:hypothetical protein